MTDQARRRRRVARLVDGRREELAALGRRSRQVVLFAAGTGVLTGLGVGLFDWLTREQLFERVGASPATADEYIRNFHDPGTPARIRAGARAAAREHGHPGPRRSHGLRGPCRLPRCGRRLLPPDTTLTEFLWHHLIGNREKAVPVVEGATYLGLMRIEELQATPEEQWSTTSVAEAMRTDFPAAAPDWLLRDALAAMEEADVDLLPVVDDTAFVGAVTTTEILKLDEILGRTTGETDVGPRDGPI